MMFQALALSNLSAEQQIGAMVLGLAIAVIFHEVAHGYVALQLGDPTAYYAGRLSLNPIKHVDLWGTLIVPAMLILPFITRGVAPPFVFGWAKPVPVNYYNLRHGRWGPVAVALAGPLTNLLILIIAGLLSRFSPAGTALPGLFYVIAQVNSALMLFNLIPIPPLDGSKVLYLFLENRPDIVASLERYGLILLISLLVFGGGLLQNFVFVPAQILVRLIVG